jgi:hypothetical protein
MVSVVGEEDGSGSSDLKVKIARWGRHKVLPQL